MVEWFAYIDIAAFWQGVLSFLPRFIAGILVFAAVYILYQGTVVVLRTAMERRKVHASIISLTVKTYKYALIIIGALLALNQMGVDLVASLTGLGVASVAVGFAARDTVANYVAGITIFWDKPFYVGDYIEVGDRYGRVTEITMRSTRIRTLQNEYLVVPNAGIVDQMVVNHSKNGELRVEIPLGISYHDNISYARAVLLSVADPDKDPRISQYLRPTVVATQLGDNGVHLLLRIWITKAEDEMAVFYDYLERAKVAIEEHGMTIPFPQRVVHVRDDEKEELWQEKRETPPLQKSP